MGIDWQEDCPLRIECGNEWFLLEVVKFLLYHGYPVTADPNELRVRTTEKGIGAVQERFADILV